MGAHGEVGEREGKVALEGQADGGGELDPFAAREWVGGVVAAEFFGAWRRGEASVVGAAGVAEHVMWEVGVHVGEEEGAFGGLGGLGEGVPDGAADAVGQFSIGEG